MSELIGKWKFDKEIAKKFDSHVENSIPMYNEIQKLIVFLSHFFIQENARVLDIGCSTGTTIKELKDNINKDFSVMGIDISMPMINQAISKLKGYNNVTFLCENIANIDIKNYNLIVSNLTLQFLSQEDKLHICKKVYDGLNMGGAFIVVEKIHSNNALMQDLYTQIYHDIKEENGFNAEEIRNKDKSLRSVLNPMDNEGNKRLLIDTGFIVDEFFRYLNFIGYLAVKKY